MRDEDLSSTYPRCYHLAHGPEAWPSIREHGLLSTAALLETWEVPAADRPLLMRQHRTADIELTNPTHGTAVLRDQRPLQVSMLERALTDMSVEDWLQQLNGHVFFAATKKRLESLYAVHQERPLLVLTVNTASLLQAHRYQIRLAAINTGAVRNVKHTRGSETFQRVSVFDSHRQVAEIAVQRAVSDIGEHVTAAEVWHPDGRREPLSL